MVSLNEASDFLVKIKDVPFPILLAGSGIILILSGMIVNKITGNSEISGIGLVLVVLGLVSTDLSE